MKNRNKKLLAIALSGTVMGLRGERKWDWLNQHTI
jgi:hypothetical protein